MSEWSQKGELRQRILDGVVCWQLRCPSCGEWAYIDVDQLYGRISVDHSGPGCSFHETRNWYETAAYRQLLPRAFEDYPAGATTADNESGVRD